MTPQQMRRCSNNNLRWSIRLALSVSALALSAGCSSNRIHVESPPPAAGSHEPPDGVFSAGAAEQDITPAMGVPLFGYSWDAAARADGVWTRLKARAIALQDSRGERLAIVQVDLGAMSGLVHRRVAAATADLGITADRLLIAATHTHAAPGGYFGEPFFNNFGAGRPGFDPTLVDDLVSNISRAIHLAFANRKQAAFAATTIELPGVTHNRSIEAQRENAGASAPGFQPVDSTLRLLRIDAMTADKTPEPLAALFVFAVHGTAMPQSNSLYHGDLHAVAARALSARIEKLHPRAGKILSAFMNGAEGDVSPCPDPDRRVPGAPLLAACERVIQAARSKENNQPVSDRSIGRGEAMAIEIGEHIAWKAAEAFESPQLQWETDPQLLHAYREVELPGNSTRGLTVCNSAVIGVATIGGAEDGRAPWYGSYGIYEGHHSKYPSPGNCQGDKLPAAGFLQSLLLIQSTGPLHGLSHLFKGGFAPESFPRVAPFQVLSLGNSMLLAGVPGEPTTEVGRSIREGLAKNWRGITQGAPPAQRVTAVVGLANEYLYYFTTPAEFHAQHYEGASTLYGPLQGVATQQQLADATLALGTPGAQQYSKSRDFFPGAAWRLQAMADCPTAGWGIVVTDEPMKSADGNFITVTFRGPGGEQNCGRYPAARIVCDHATLRGADGAFENDEGYRFVFSRLHSDTWQPDSKPSLWQARWRVSKDAHQSTAHCRMEISKNAEESFSSAEFKL